MPGCISGMPRRRCGVAPAIARPTDRRLHLRAVHQLSSRSRAVLSYDSSVELPFSPLSKNLPAPTINTSAGFATDVKEHKKMDAGTTVCVVRVAHRQSAGGKFWRRRSEFPPIHNSGETTGDAR